MFLLMLFVSCIVVSISNELIRSAQIFFISRQDHLRIVSCNPVITTLI